MVLDINGQKLYLHNPGVTTIENEIYWNGIKDGWEKISLELWQHLAKNAQVILDIGANSGIAAFIAQSVNSEALFMPLNR